MIHIGNQTSCGAALTEPFDYAINQNFDAFEWFPDKKPGTGWDESDLQDGARFAIAETARSRGMRLSVHARLQADPLLPDGTQLLWKDLELALSLRAVLLNIHLFHYQGQAAFVEAVLPLIRRTSEAGLQLAIENTPEHSPEQFNDLFARLRALNSVETRHVGMCLDLGHANLCPATRNDYLGFCDRLDPRVPIIHVHLHENWGDADSHLPLFTGPAGRDDSGIRALLARLKRRNFSGSFILEQWPHPPSLLREARDRLLHLWEAGVVEQPPNISLEPPLPEVKAPSAGSPTAFVSELAAQDRRLRSWREKLAFVGDLLVREKPNLTSDQLIDIAVYLRFLGTGKIVCAEDGRHFRPAHHARISAQIHERLARLTSPDNAFIVRRIYPWLPSSAPAFQRPEPLTRIRDIAHRNDIGPDLKREIKHTLQNKLHRCADPGDLATSSALLQRITAPGADYPPAFVEQFKIFHEELKEFFNARSLEHRLQSLQPLINPPHAELIDRFLRQRAGREAADPLAVLRTLTALRAGLLEGLARKPPAETQERLLADLALEDFAFVLLSEIINQCVEIPSAALAESATEALILGLNHLSLSGIDPPESSALQSELLAWGRLSSPAGRDELLRLKATLRRCRRLAEDFAERTIALFAARAEKLGRALGLAEHSIRVFSESEVRGHIVFQVSKLVSGLLRRVREHLALPAWDVLVGGRAVGRVKTLTSLVDFDRGLEEPVLLLLKSATGEEEIPRSVAGIVLAHELPHLSHLGVRVRQAGIVLVTCEEAAEFEGARKFEGQVMSLLALPEKVAWEGAEQPGTPGSRPRLTAPEIPPVRLAPESHLIPLSRAALDTSGGKAAGARRLFELSNQPTAGFKTPPALVVPFGVMEAALAAAPELHTEYRDLSMRIDTMSPAESAAAAWRLRDLVAELVVPDALISEVRRRFQSNTALIVRSSANCEDLEKYASAGLYDSVLNVPPAEVASAVRTVWSSLWTERAVLSRREAGIAQGQAHMAVLVQELLEPELAFVLRTVNPISGNVAELYAEIVVGLGVTLASAATRGSPYRLAGVKQSGTVNLLAFADFSRACRPNPRGGLQWETVDYSRIGLSRDPETLAGLGRRLAAIGSFVERAMGNPMDIEGALANDQIYLLQARPQPGLPPGKPL